MRSDWIQGHKTKWKKCKKSCKKRARWWLWRVLWHIGTRLRENHETLFKQVKGEQLRKTKTKKTKYICLCMWVRVTIATHHHYPQFQSSMKACQQSTHNLFCVPFFWRNARNHTITHTIVLLLQWLSRVHHTRSHFRKQPMSILSTCNLRTRLTISDWAF